MALIQCPECQREISDKVKNCPHCGYPLSEPENASNISSATATTAVKKTEKKKFVFAIIAVIVIIIAVIAVITVQRSNQKIAAHDEYIENLIEVRYLMLSGAADAESLCNLTKSVWFNTIYEKYDTATDKYTRNDRYQFNSDFNTSLSNLYADDSTKKTIENIKENQSSVAELMKSLQNPTEEFKTCYDTMSETYDMYLRMTSMAVSPSGSLQSFTEDFNSADDDFIALYNKLETQIPEKIREPQEETIQ